MTGDMVNSVRKSAMPTNTMFGGFCCKPMAERRNEKEMMYRVNDVIITTMEGSNITSVVMKRICSVCTLSPFTLIKLSNFLPPYGLRCSNTLRSASRKWSPSPPDPSGPGCEPGVIQPSASSFVKTRRHEMLPEETPSK